MSSPKGGRPGPTSPAGWLLAPAGCVLRWEAEGNELTLCSDGDISMGQRSSITLRWLGRAVNCFELAGCLLRCSQGWVPREASLCTCPFLLGDRQTLPARFQPAWVLTACTRQTDIHLFAQRSIPGRIHHLPTLWPGWFCWSTPAHTGGQLASVKMISTQNQRLCQLKSHPTYPHPSLRSLLRSQPLGQCLLAGITSKAHACSQMAH